MNVINNKIIKNLNNNLKQQLKLVLQDYNPVKLIKDYIVKASYDGGAQFKFRNQKILQAHQI